jgi:adenine-specific DNA-methyltransferase
MNCSLTRALPSGHEPPSQGQLLFVDSKDFVVELVTRFGGGLETARFLTYHLALAYWSKIAEKSEAPCSLSDFGLRLGNIPKVALTALSEYAATLASRPSDEASFEIGSFYMSLLPVEFRSAHGIYYTPPALVSRLLALVEAQGVNWNKARAIDPACGGGAFVAPIVARKVLAAHTSSAERTLKEIGSSVKGVEIDPFAAWLSQFFAEAAALPICRKAGQRLPRLVEVADSLQHRPEDENAFDVVIGNPPYSRVTLAPELRRRYARSLFGHANLYGMFTDQALRLANSGGHVAYVTPTSFLGGQYFQNLRHVLRSEASPIALEFVAERSGVFEDVLQETMLAVYRKGVRRNSVSVGVLESINNKSTPRQLGIYKLPEDVRKPWLLPRSANQDVVVLASHHLTHSLRDYGYEVNTGPLVWNRHKNQMVANSGPRRHPIVWAESLTPQGTFVHRSEKRNHAPFLQWEGPQDDWLLTDRPCILVQRTTAKEQTRRLICAVMPQAFVKKHGAVAVENHLNMVRPSRSRSSVSLEAIAAVLRSRTADILFRCINGSVAVSAYELESLPLPGPAGFAIIEKAIKEEASEEEIDDLVHNLYVKPDAASA